MTAAGRGIPGVVNSNRMATSYESCRDSCIRRAEKICRTIYRLPIDTK